MSSPSASDWRWFAAIIDGEGHISMVERSNGCLARRLAITNTNLPLLIAVARGFGGKIHTHRPVRGTKTSFQWYCYGDTLRMLLTGILPYLIGKREEATLCLAFDQARQFQRGHKLTPSAVQEYRMLLKHVDRLRRRSWRARDVPVDLRPNRSRV